MRFAKMFITMLAMVTFILLTTATTTFALGWEDWESGFIRVEGMAAAPPIAISNTLIKTYTRQAAKIDALRLLVENEVMSYPNGSIIKSDLNSDKIISTVEATRDMATIKSARVIDEREYEGGGYGVTMELKLFGKDSLADAVFSEYKKLKKYNFPVPTSVVNKEEYNKYTGLIVDCRNLQHLSPKFDILIKNNADRYIYHAQYLDYSKISDKVINHGMADFSRDIKSQTRAGKNPIIIKAIEIKKGSIIISDGDLYKIAAANQYIHFLDNCNVVILH